MIFLKIIENVNPYPIVLAIYPEFTGRKSRKSDKGYLKPEKKMRQDMNIQNIYKVK